MNTQHSNRRGLRFGLKGLLIVVAICAYIAWSYAQLPTTVTQTMVAGVPLGAPPEVVFSKLGEPTRVEELEEGAFKWWYDGENPLYVWFEDHKYGGALFKSDISFQGRATKSNLRQQFGPPTKRMKHGDQEEWRYDLHDSASYTFVFDENGNCRSTRFSSHRP